MSSERPRSVTGGSADVDPRDGPGGDGPLDLARPLTVGWHPRPAGSAWPTSGAPAPTMARRVLLVGAASSCQSPVPASGTDPGRRSPWAQPDRRAPPLGPRTRSGIRAPRSTAHVRATSPHPESRRASRRPPRLRRRTTQRPHGIAAPPLALAIITCLRSADRLPLFGRCGAGLETEMTRVSPRRSPDPGPTIAGTITTSRRSAHLLEKAPGYATCTWEARGVHAVHEL